VRRALVWVTVLGLLMSACGDKAIPPSRVITITFTQEPDNLNPLYTTMWFSAVTREFWLRTTLLTWNDANEPRPEIATEVPSLANGGLSSDGLTLTYHLRPDVKWSDGQPLTADDYVFTYRMLMSDQNTVQTRDPYDKYVASVEAPQPHTLVIRFRRPFAAWQSRIFGSSNGGAIPKHILEPVFGRDGTLDRAEWNRQPTVGYGPFQFQNWETGSYLQFVAGSTYWRGAPRLERLFIRIVPNDTSQLATLKTGDTDIGVFLSWSDVPELQQLDAFNVVQVSSGYKESWFFNLSPERGHPALQDERVRRALVMAVNREAISKDLLSGLTRPAQTFWDHSSFGVPAAPLIAYDPAGAAQLLDAAGWQRGADGQRSKDGRPLVLRYVTTSRDIRRHTQVIVQQMLQEVGIGVVLQDYPSDVFFGSYSDGGPVATGQYDIAQWTAAPDAFPDPDTAQWLCAEIPSDQRPVGSNWTYLCDATLDRLFRQQASTIDITLRHELLRRIIVRLTEQVYWVSLWDDPDLFAIKKRLKHVRLSGVAPYWNCYEWEVAP
jgi:peptide/nickel transport system substrate-binding protein